MDKDQSREMEHLTWLEKDLRFTYFDSDTALAIGMEIVDSVRRRGKVVEVDIEFDQHVVFRFAMTGWKPAFEKWIQGKKVIQKMYGCCGLLVHLKLQAEGRKFSEKHPDLADLDGLAVGGGFPIRLKNDETIRGWVTVTGLAHRDDHDVVVKAMRKVLGGG